MTFSNAFEMCLTKYNISISALSDVSGISKSMLSRIKTGKKVPASNSELLERLASGIAQLAPYDEVEDALNELYAAASDESFDMYSIISGLNNLIASLDINVSDLSRYLNFDASYISRIRSGHRRPSNVSEFCMGVADFVSLRYGADFTVLAGIMGCNPSDMDNHIGCRDCVYQYLTERKPHNDNYVAHFLSTLDSFDLNEYISALQFGGDILLSEPVAIPQNKNYYTINGFMQSELDWIYATLQSPLSKSAVFYSDMPMEEMSQSTEFAKKWMMGIALLMKKGIHLSIVHNVERSAAEMMLGLEGWIPLYMTGLVSPYYLKNNHNQYFNHFLRVSESAALAGEAVRGFHNEGQYHFTQSREELLYYQNRGRALLSRALPLMNIYRKENQSEYCDFIKKSCSEDKTFFNRSILSAPPVYTISDDLLNKILEKNNISSDITEKIKSYVISYKNRICSYIQSGVISDELSVLSEDEFSSNPVSLALSDIFFDFDCIYTYEDYLEHIRLTEQFSSENENYHFVLKDGVGFCNISIRISEGNAVLISKGKSPSIHFVIRHPKLRQAIENLSIPIVE